MIKEILYFCEVETEWGGRKMYLHRDGKEGRLLLIGCRKALRTGATFQFPNDSEIILEDRPKLGFSLKNYFNYNGLRYCWHGISKLKTEDGTVVAKFDRSYFIRGRDGELHVYEDGRGMIPIIIATLMSVLYRRHEEEGM
jgi:hypothetical protein